METIEDVTPSSDMPLPAVCIRADIAQTFTYASYQNAIPVLRALRVENPTQDTYENCRLELVADPPFLRAKTWTIDRLIPGDELPISDRKVELDAGYLAGLNEAERGEISLRLNCAESVLAELRLEVRLLARDEWGGVDDMAQLLPAFVMPNDPAVASILRTAAEQLIKHGHSGALDGYQSQSPQRSFMLTAAIYSAISGLGLHYAEPPTSFETRGQKVRRPTTVSQERLATCLDTSLLFASALEATGLHPIILMFNGHSAAGVWLTRRTLSNSVEADAMEVRKALASRELVVFETTGVTHRPAITLEAAQQTITRRLQDDDRSDFVVAIDVRRARSGGITPLASHEPVRRAVPDEINSETGILPLPAAPALSALPTEEVEVKPTSAAGRIDRWQKKLLDLTLRNRLLNFPESKKTIPFLCTDVGYLEDRLSDSAAIRLISLPEQNPLGQRDPSLYREVHGKDIQRNFAAEALKRDELSSPLEGKTLESRLIDLYRQVKNDFAEGGANTLFLAVGFLRWKKKVEDERTYRAPLLLVPVKLERRSASSRFTLRYHEDEPRFNATLLQFLERDFDLHLPQFAEDLPTDESGVDVPRLLSMMRKAVRDVPGMEVVDETALSTFSFAKFLMWKDLVERTNALRENRVVRHLIDTPEQSFNTGEGEVTFLEERDIDRKFAPSDVICLLPADSSQLAASMAAADGRDFVIVGPPGTGKSQTIANMIANCLANGKTVLFVAEKTAALDVVYRRLREHGLGDHCLELHSNKSDRRHFFGQLKASWESANRADEAEWVAVNEKLKLRRDELNAYVDALHKPYRNGWTAYRAIGIALRGQNDFAPELSWSGLQDHDEADIAKLEAIADETGLAFASVQFRPSLKLSNQADWSSQWQDEFLAAGQTLEAAIDATQQAEEAFETALGIPIVRDPSQAGFDATAQLANALVQSAGHDIRIAFDPELSKMRAALEGLKQSIKEYRESEAGLSARYDMSALSRLDVDEVDRQWRQALASGWPGSMLGKRKVQKLLQSYVQDGDADPDTDLLNLSGMLDARKAADENPLAKKPIGFSGLQSDVDLVENIIGMAEAVRQSLALPDREAVDLRPAILVVREVLDGSRTDTQLQAAARRLLAARKSFETQCASYENLASVPVNLTGQAGQLANLRDQLQDLERSAHLLRDWSAWCSTRQRAVAVGMTPLVDALEDGRVAAAEMISVFRLAYARWWLPKALDADTVLRSFRRFQHENAITDFREIDALVRAAATRRVESVIAHGLPSVQSVPRNSELGLLRHQMELQRPSRSIREMIGNMPSSFSKLAPCMLMSPLSIAQYMPPDQSLFDVVIFDEASQITTWDAVGAIARARQTIIVGDPRQLPPTNFFGRNEADEEVEDYEKDLESILDEAKASGIPVRDLRWHYRSRSESLIAFSNHNYYQNRLITFPGPNVDDQAVKLIKVPHGIYDRGKSRTNKLEADAVAREAVARMRLGLALEEARRPTIGVITFNAQQQGLIDDLLDAARMGDPELEWYFADERIEPTIVKNLENVQGDERDIILFSITFSQDAAGKRAMDFGALNRDGGERRLNVAVTRARQELLVFSGFTADEINLSRTKGAGVRDLKAFLDYAERGAIALPAQDQGSQGGYESPFEEAVAEELVQRGWSLVPQVGISGFRIDIGVRHPDLDAAYLAGVECDGATYHSSATARDRDVVREQVLRGLGWNILRIWSTDWWFDPQGCADRLDEGLDALLKESRENQAVATAKAPEQHWDMGQSIEPQVTEASEVEVENIVPVPLEVAPDVIEMSQAANVDLAPQVRNLSSVPPNTSVEQASALPTPGGSLATGVHIMDGQTDKDTADNLYQITDLSGFPADPARFHDFDYRGTLGSMIQAVIENEAPLPTDVLAQRIARAHGWLRTGAKIRERIDLHLRNAEKTVEDGREFVWRTGAVAEVVEYREPANEDGKRSIADISLAELASVVLKYPDLLVQPDPAHDMARLLGVERLAASSRARLEVALERARPLITG